ncbi:amino acid/polyamine transporter I [Talaromyces proteolyticus]|uniref:Amino acid/polyamine transporter I n=1 Tax=Talaromyces proteolyticus TaxID=1131652 RepID=A0AAD4PZY3_9EURO|nr:amino acid/polyamine transporter I [Talaromyces proteolyticus]KAH8696441.1 amino acid/polyamine transporter I [Talaromyces proteolyticus]
MSTFKMREIDVQEQPGAQNISRKGFTRRDEIDMARLGKRQRFHRIYGFLSMLGFTTTMMCTWEAVFFANTTAMVDGGPVSLVYGYIFCFFGTLATAASLGELASMSPTSGGQYHWVAQLSPEKSKVFLSWLTGWSALTGWWANTASAIYFAGTMIQGLLVLNKPSYVIERWQGTLLMFAFLIVVVFVNTIAARLLPKIEGLILSIHIVGFFAILIPLVYLAPHSSAEFVFTEFANSSGWSSNGLVWFIALMSSNLPFIGYDGPCHMAEEIQNASIIVPWCMVSTVMINGLLGLAMTLVFLFCIGNLDDALSSPTGYDFIEVFQNATNSHAGTSIMTAILIVLVMSACFGFLASASRLTWALARDRGTPFSNIINNVSERTALPMNSILLCTALTALICVINIASTTAFNAIVSLTIVGLYSSYLIAISLVLKKRILGETVDFGPWTMGPFGIFVNACSMFFLIISITFSFFPPMYPVTNTNMNWSIVVFGGEMILGLCWYAIRGRHQYNGPIVESPIVLDDQIVNGSFS